MSADNAGHDTRGAVAYSDSFFPFIDSVGALVRAGIRIICTTSGSVCDDRVVGLCSKRGVTLYMEPDSVARSFYGH